MSAEPWQLLPSLTDEEFAALKADVATHGILVPVVVDADTGAVLDGHHRLRAYEELRREGVSLPDYPREVRRFADDEERAGYVLAANLFRRHLTRQQRAEVVARLREKGWSLRRLSGALGVHHETVRRDLRGVVPATPGRRVVGRDEKSYAASRPRPAPSILVRSARDEARARSALTALGDKAPGPDLRRAEEKARLAALARRRAEEVPTEVSGAGYEIRLGDFREALSDVGDDSVDAIVCDPPYNHEGLPTYSMLSEFAARVLKPGRLCVAYCGKTWLPQRFEHLGEHLDYLWTGCVWQPGRHTVVHRPLAFARWRPVAFFSKGTYEARMTIIDGIVSPGRGDKTSGDHPWQQSIAPFVRLIEMATRSGEVVVDPFLGSGTTAIACLASGRRFVGADLDPGAVSLALERIGAYERGELAIEPDLAHEAGEADNKDASAAIASEQRTAASSD